MEKRLYKTAYNKMISGVCNGLAEYLNIDVSIVRIIYAIFTIASFGTALLLYIVVAIILPTKNY
ncbi:MAG: PspC domain-containing protein [Erysipelotrichales bacterium]